MIHVNVTGIPAPDGVDYVVATPDTVALVDAGIFAEIVQHANAITKLVNDNQKPLTDICAGEKTGRSLY